MFEALQYNLNFSLTLDFSLNMERLKKDESTIAKTCISWQLEWKFLKQRTGDYGGGHIITCSNYVNTTKQ